MECARSDVHTASMGSGGIPPGNFLVVDTLRSFLICFVTLLQGEVCVQSCTKGTLYLSDRIWRLSSILDCRVSSMLRLGVSGGMPQEILESSKF